MLDDSNYLTVGGDSMDYMQMGGGGHSGHSGYLGVVKGAGSSASSSSSAAADNAFGVSAEYDEALLDGSTNGGGEGFTKSGRPRKSKAGAKNKRGGEGANSSSSSNGPMYSNMPPPTSTPGGRHLLSHTHMQGPANQEVSNRGATGKFFSSL
jgi:hypothetical protein